MSQGESRGRKRLVWSSVVASPSSVSSREKTVRTVCSDISIICRPQPNQAERQAAHMYVGETGWQGPLTRAGWGVMHRQLTKWLPRVAARNSL